MAQLTLDMLQTRFHGRHISEICVLKYDDSTQDHCAHFVSHVLGLRYGLLCGDLLKSSTTKHNGVSVRCNDIYNNLKNRGAWESSESSPRDGLLVFVTYTSNVRNNQMGDGKKHVGICCNNNVFSYANSKNKVIRDPTVEHFFEVNKNIYGGNVSLYWALPTWPDLVILSGKALVSEMEQAFQRANRR